MKQKVLCPKWGRCKAIKKCPLDKSAFEEFDVYVFGKCANKDIKIIRNRIG